MKFTDISKIAENSFWKYVYLVLCNTVPHLRTFWIQWKFCKPLARSSSEGISPVSRTPSNCTTNQYLC